MQCTDYLKATGAQLCLLFNFGKSRMQPETSRHIEVQPICRPGGKGAKISGRDLLARIRKSRSRNRRSMGMPIAHEAPARSNSLCNRSENQVATRLGDRAASISGEAT